MLHTDQTSADYVIVLVSLATACDGQFVLRGPSGSFSSSDVSDTYKNNSVCRWIIRSNNNSNIIVHKLCKLY